MLLLPTLLFLAESAGPSDQVVLWTVVLSALGGMLASITTLAKGQMDRAQARKDKVADAAAAALLHKQEAEEAAQLREEDRKDAECKARIILQEGANRERRLAAAIAENTEVSIEAFKAANGHNEKIAAAVETVAKVAEVAKAMVQTAPKEIHVTVDNNNHGTPS